MDSLMRLLLGLLNDARRWCDICTTRDGLTITRRVGHEGLSFLTITLPNFCADFERSLDIGYIDPTFFLGFKKNGLLPRFLGGLISRVFDADTGVLLSEPDVHSIFFVRQITLACKKIEMPCDPKRVSQAYKRFIECEKELTIDVQPDSKHFRSSAKRFSFFAEALWAPRLAGLDFLVSNQEIVPKHGPGAVAERIRGNSKFSQSEWPLRLERSFPYELFGIPNSGFYEEIDNINFLDPGAERPVRVITVPKTMTTPRIIAIEPLCMQYTQQSLLEILVPALTDLTNGALGFRDQTVNQSWALNASKTGDYATLDLSEASDRVHRALVWRMLKFSPNLRKAVFNCRSRRADVPGHGVIPLNKFASMGSALCFPIESMVFLTICLMGWCKAKGTSPIRSEILLFLDSVRIYGDDIIIPVDIVSDVVSELKAFRLKVNDSKSFWTGKFRESCGLEAYDGTPVTPVRIRRMPPTRHQDVDARLSWFSLRNQLYFAGLWEAAKVCETVLGKQPIVGRNSGALGYHSFLPLRDVGRWNTDLHIWETRAEVPVSKSPPSALDGVGALMKFFLKRGSDPIFDPKHLERSGRPDCVRTKIRWVPAS